MPLNGSLADEELGGDRAVALARGNEPENLRFPHGQRPAMPLHTVPMRRRSDPWPCFQDWGRLTPFAIDLDRHRLRLRGPDSLRSPSYARDLNFLKSFGSLNSSERNADQTATAYFWFEGEDIWNDIGRRVIERENLDPWQSARILALVNFALADGFIAWFEAKYRFHSWRPNTAIHRAAEDRNDDLWTPPGKPLTFLIPLIPDYPSAAAVTSAAAAEVLGAHLGKHVRFDATSVTLPGVTRRFDSFEQAAHESGWSRVYGGIHFIHAVEDGLAQGRDIGREISRMLERAGR